MVSDSLGMSETMRKCGVETECGERKHGMRCWRWNGEGKCETMKTGDNTGPIWCDGAELMLKLVWY